MTRAAALCLSLTACQPGLRLTDYALPYDVQGLTVTVTCALPLWSGCGLVPALVR